MPHHEMYTVKKFGGTSVGTIERIEAVADRIWSDLNEGQKPVITASAMSGETNRLVSLADQVDRGYRGRAYDMLLASGEQVSISLLAMALEKRSIPTRPLLAHQVGIYTDSIFSRARIQKVNGKALLRWVDRGIVPIVAGFQGIDKDEQITTLGRGGSDTTAVALAAALELEGKKTLCEIYTDVPAVFTADPRLVPKAREIKRLAYEEMMEMASLGTKVLHVRAVELAAKFGISVHVRSSLEQREGTWIEEEKNEMEHAIVSAVSHETGTVIFKLFPVPNGSGILAELFSDLAKFGIVVDIITQSQNEEGQRLALSTSEEDFEAARNYFSGKFANSQVQIVEMKNMAKLSVIGVGMRNHSGVAARFFKVLSDRDVPVHLVSTSEIKISVVIDGENIEKAACGVHTEFELDQ